LRIDSGGRSHAGWISLTQREALIEVQISPSLAAVSLAVLAGVRRLLDLDADLDAIEAGLGLFARRPGLRVPGAMDGFEVAVRAVLGQLVSVAQAQRFAAWIAARMGTPLETAVAGLNRLFPSAAELAARAPEEFLGSGIARPRVAAILALARAVRDGELSLHPGADRAATRAALRALPGFGEWTVEYVAMRALSDPDALPASDLGIKKALGLSSAAAIRRAAEAWRPFRSYAVMQAWLGPVATALSEDAP
jgi:AraC family transcriptional regulator of adaptative response / DNA-3-methyladenine glycosylase II